MREEGKYMSELYEVYKCKVCGSSVEVVDSKDAELVCHGQPMRELAENTVDASKEKHVPVVESTANGILVKIGSVPHPMEEKHYIEWIEVFTDDKIYKAQLKPGMAPQAEFPVKAGDVRTVRELCNIHELWKA